MPRAVCGSHGVSPFVLEVCDVIPGQKFQYFQKSRALVTDFDALVPSRQRVVVARVLLEELLLDLGAIGRSGDWPLHARSRSSRSMSSSLVWRTSLPWTM